MSGRKLNLDELEKQKILESTGVIGFKERLQIVLQGQSGNAFSKKVGMSEAVIRDYLSGKTYPSLNRLAVISQKCGVPFEWLATGKGSCHLVSGNNSSNVSYIPVYDIYSANITEVDNKDITQNSIIRYMPFPSNWIERHRFNEEDIIICNAKGDSMMPTISDNDTLFINKANTNPFDGYMYLVNFGGALSIKRIQNHGAYLLLLCDNNKYQDIKIEQDQDVNFNIIGRIVGIFKDYP